jgi:uncharacterized membrane protein YgdD (TMEM256/DUF423 family)
MAARSISTLRASSRRHHGASQCPPAASTIHGWATAGRVRTAAARKSGQTVADAVAQEAGMARRWFVLGAMFALLAVAAGAFGAHALRARLTPEALAIFDTGARYQMAHALALLATAWAATRWPGRWVASAGALFTVGIVLFSGSLYVLALTGARAFGAVTPVGGVAFIAGWACLALAALRAPRD